ncbi:MAG: hypothetical protein K6G10_10140 [Butyrivibrio sp.]|nr:hypothetical protein [Butyrivibrio sp.]
MKRFSEKIKKAGITLTAAAALAAILVACGPSDEKLAEAEEARTILLGAKEAAEETYLDITQSDEKARLDELGESLKTYEEMDFTKMRDKKIDEVLPAMKELTESYQQLGSSLSDVLKKENAERQEQAKNHRTETFIINKTGLNLTEIRLHDITKDELSDNFLKEGSTLETGYTVMGTALMIREDSSEWEFVVKDEAGTEHSLPCENLKGAWDKGVSITLTYDSKADTGLAKLGAYIAEPALEPAAGAESSAAAEGGSATGAESGADNAAGAEASAE